MRSHPLSPEEKADLALESLEGIKRADVPAGFEEKMFARFDAAFGAVAKTPKWFWVAAAVILSINIAAAWKYSASSKAGMKAQSNMASSYFQGGTDWYQE